MVGGAFSRAALKSSSPEFLCCALPNVQSNTTMAQSAATNERMILLPG
jgi:hypothetical protein